jgi:hypothetical protein
MLRFLRGQDFQGRSMARRTKFNMYRVSPAVLTGLMQDLHWSPTELSRQSGVDVKTIKRPLDKPDALVTRDVLMALASAFNKELPPGKHLDWTGLIDAAPRNAPQDAFLTAFRRCFGGLHSLIEPPGLPGSASYWLESLYVSPRLVPDERRSSVGELDVGDLLSRKRHLSILGPPGSGKTTWLRWMFRQLLSHDALPIPIDLRTFSRSWDLARRNVLQFLCHWLSEWMDDDALIAEFRSQIKSTSGPRPVLLLDSWDQLGDELGTELHEKLGAFLRTSPRVLAVVTSRLYGKGRPGRNDNFEVMELQPLDETRIMALVQQYCIALDARGEDAREPPRSDAWTQQIGAAITISPQVKELARNPLLLTMLVAVGRHRELPRERHVLYQRCIEEMLSARPEIAEHWRPERADAQDALEHLAFGMQDLAYSRPASESAERRSVAVSLDQACALLPRSWNWRDKERFLTWLVDACGILSHDEETYAFAHLSLQDYLAAGHLSKRPQLPITHRVFAHHWWETLRVLAALLDPEAADRRIAELLAVAPGPAHAASFWLAGVLFADRSSVEDRQPAGDAAFESWLAGLRDRFRIGEWRDSLQAARAWQASHRTALRARITSDCTDWTWVRWVRAREWASEAGLAHAFDVERDGACRRTTRAMAAILDDSAPWDADMVALSRVLHGSGPFWPAPRWELMLLRAWPSRRVRLGQILQLLASVGADRATLVDAATRWLAEPDEYLMAKGEIYGYIRARPDIPVEPLEVYAKSLAYNLSLQFGHHVGKALSLSERPILGIDPVELATKLARWLSGPSIVDMTRDQLTDLCRRISHESRPDLGKPWASITMQALSNHGVDVAASQAAWMDFGLVESHSRARYTTPIALAFGGDLWGCDDRVALLASACRSFLDVGAQDLDDRLDRARAMDPLWPALARYLSGEPAEADPALLTRTAELAEHRDPILSWGLRFYVRGDIVMDDGELTLDEICRAAGRPRLPLLDGHPLQQRAPEASAP